MTSIVITEEQAQVIKSSVTGVEIRSPQGECLGILSAHGFTGEDIALAKLARNSKSPRYTTAQVLAHLQSLEPR
jgi:hypothetical protein